MEVGPAIVVGGGTGIVHVTVGRDEAGVVDELVVGATPQRGKVALGVSGKPFELEVASVMVRACAHAVDAEADEQGVGTVAKLRAGAPSIPQYHQLSKTKAKW